MSVCNTCTLGEHILLALLKLRSKFNFGRSQLPLHIKTSKFYSISVNTQDRNVADENFATNVVTCISVDIFYFTIATKCQCEF